MEILKPPLDLAGYGILSISTGRTKMPDEVPLSTLDTELTTNIVAAYVRPNQIGPGQVSVLIATVLLAPVGRGKPAAETAIDRTPAVTIRQSVHRAYVV